MERNSTKYLRRVFPAPGGSPKAHAAYPRPTGTRHYYRATFTYNSHREGASFSLRLLHFFLSHGFYIECSRDTFHGRVRHRLRHVIRVSIASTNILFRCAFFLAWGNNTAYRRIYVCIHNAAFVFSLKFATAGMYRSA